MFGAAFRDAQERHHRQDNAHRDIDEEDTAPSCAEQVCRDEPTAQEKSGYHAQGVQGADDAEYRPPLFRRVHDLNAGQHLRHHDAGEGALNDPGRYEGVPTPGQGSEH